MVTRLLSLTGLLGALAAAPLLGQQGLDSMSIVQLRPERFVRLQVPDLGRVQGTVRLRTGTEVVLSTGTEDRTIQLGAVDTLWVRGRRTLTGAIIGGVLGIGGGIFLGALADGLCEYDCSGNNVVGGAVFGLAAGAAAGALVGTAFPRWRRVFPD